MRATYAVALMLTILLAGTYWYSSVEAVCKLPVYYTLGELDERFGLSETEVKNRLSEAESVWEDATGRNLFTYLPEADMKVNFIYDDRQASADAAEAAKERLEVTETVNEKLGETYAELIAKYNERELSYESRRADYEQRLNQYNARVEKYNQEGGAPPDVYEELQQEKEHLDQDRKLVNAMAEELNELSFQINQIGEQGNVLIDKYNENVRRFNDVFGHSEEFTQGDYEGRDINIYTFQNSWELKLVLAHEFGHALALGHVENEKSIMYYLLGEQPLEIEPSAEDLAEFQSVCGDVTTYERLREQISNWLKSHSVI